jgi:hypothetical protein
MERTVEIHHPLRENHHLPRVLGNHPAASTFSITLIKNSLFQNKGMDQNLAPAMQYP